MRKKRFPKRGERDASHRERRKRNYSMQSGDFFVLAKSRLVYNCHNGYYGHDVFVHINGRI